MRRIQAVVRTAVPRWADVDAMIAVIRSRYGLRLAQATGLRWSDVRPD